MLQYKETLTEHIAEQTMVLNDTTLFLSFVSMIWRDQYITIVFNNTDYTITDIWFDPVLQTGDREIIERLVSIFLDN